MKTLICTILSSIVLISLVFFLPNAYASFDFWDINEIYSNADGTLQFIELTTFVNGQQFLTNHTITSNSDGIVNTFILTNNTPSPTANRTILFATSSLTSVPGFPVPDFIIPDNFFNPTANTITLNFGESSDIVTLTSGQLPTNGLESSDDNGNSQLASPTNYNGDTGIPPFESPDTFQISIPTNSSNLNCSQIKNLCYSPDFLTVGLGDIVTWTNNDGTTHTTTSTGELSWDSGTMSPNDEFSFSMTAVGTHEYFCTIHPWMTGTIKVVDPGAISVPSGASLAGNCDTPNTCFNPEFTTVGEGDIVTWTNNDNIEHTITSGTPNDGPDGLWDSGNLSPGEGFSIVAPSAGSYNYFCTIHPFQTGILDVVDLTSNPILPVIPKGSITIDLELVASDLVAPVHLTHAGDGTGRLFVVDQPGQILIIDNTGTLLEQPFLDMTSDIIELGFFKTFDENDFDERGLLGLAFHPQFTNSADPGFRKIYTFSSQKVSGLGDFTVSLPSGIDMNNQNVITEWAVDESNPNLIDTSTKREVMRVDEPQFNHQGGMLAFGPDGYLYISLGDGGDADDTGDGHGTIGNGQDGSTILGTIVRIDPIRPSDTSPSSDNVSANGQYRIPNTNPFLLDSNILDEIYALGLRNPFRFSFDTMTSDLIVADVGQNLIEEINVIQAGGNYGWNLKEGTFAFDSTASPVSISFDLEGLVGELIDPVVQYDHTEGISIIGGFVYRGSAIPELDGQYVFGDFSLGFFVPNGRIFYVNLNDGQINEFIIAADDLPLNTFVKSTGQDESGELYFLVGQNLGPFQTSTGQSLGQVLKIIPFIQPTILPTLSTVSISSNNADPTLAVPGDTVTLTFVADKAIQAVTATIDQAPADSITNTSDNMWEASLEMDSGDTVGTIEFTIDFQDLDGLAGIQVTSTTDGSSVTFSESASSLPDRSYNNDLLSVYNARTDLQDFFPEAATGDLGRLYGWAWQFGVNESQALLGQHEAMYSLLWVYHIFREDLRDVFPEAAFGEDITRLLEWAALSGITEHANILADDEAFIDLVWVIQKFRPDLAMIFPGAINGDDLSDIWEWAALSGVNEHDNILREHEATIVLMWVYENFRLDLQAAYPEANNIGILDGLVFWADNFGVNDHPNILGPFYGVPLPPEITSPTTNSSFVVNQLFTITGTSDPFALIELFLDEVLVLSTTANSAGNWSFSNFSISTIGSHNIAVDATISGSTVEGDSITLFIITGGGGY